jgi:hypothetical protein
MPTSTPRTQTEEALELLSAGPVNIVPLNPVVGVYSTILEVSNPPRVAMILPSPSELETISAFNTAVVVPPTTTEEPLGSRLNAVPGTVTAGSPAANVCVPIKKVGVIRG